MRWLHIGLLTLVLLPTWSLAADLTKVDRMIGKQPAYKSRPKYGLLVLGPEAKTRVWLVVDGDTLYVDRNGNGDLTEPGKRIPAKGREKYGLVFEAGDQHEGALLHTALTVTVGDFAIWADELRSNPDYQRLIARDPQARSYAVTMQAAMPGWKGAGSDGRVLLAAGYFDGQGILQFGDRPEDAPVIHFRGPWSVNIPNRPSLTVGESSDFFVSVGTPGLGPGTFACAGYQGLVPDGVFPVLDFALPPRIPGLPPVQVHYNLKSRC